MNISPEDIVSLSQSICETMLELPAGEEEQPIPAALDHSHSAYTRVSGAWNGLVAIECPPVLARRAASIMFGLPVSELTPDDLRDGVLELANVVGGNIKGMLPEPCRLSLPGTVSADVQAELAGMTLATRVEVPADGHFLVVTVLKNAA